MAALDWIFLGLVAFSMLLGFWRGLMFQLLTLAGWIAAFVLAQWLAAVAGDALPMSNASAALRYAAGFALVFIASVFAATLLARLAQKLMAVSGLSPADRMLGGAFGLVRALVLLLALTVVISLTPLHSADWWRQSASAVWLSAALSGLKPLLPAELAQYLPG